MWVHILVDLQDPEARFDHFDPEWDFPGKDPSITHGQVEHACTCSEASAGLNMAKFIGDNVPNAFQAGCHHDNRQN